MIIADEEFSAVEAAIPKEKLEDFRLKAAGAEEIITDLMDDHDMTVSDLLDIYGDIESVRDIVRWTTEDSYEDDY